MKKILLALLLLSTPASAEIIQYSPNLAGQITAIPVPVNQGGTGSTTGSSTGLIFGTTSTLTGPHVSGDLTTGLFSDTASTIEFSAGGVKQGGFNTSGLFGTGNLLTVTALGTTASLSLASHTAQTYNAKNWSGVICDGTNDDTAGLSAASAAVKSLVLGSATQSFRTGKIELGGGTCRVCGLTLYGNTYFADGNIKVTDTCSGSAPVIASEGWATNTGSGKYCGHDPSVPAWFGLSNVTVDGNKTNASYTGPLVALYGPAQMFGGQVTISYAAGNYALDTEDSSSSNFTPECQEEPRYDNLLIAESASAGWLYNGGHDGVIDTFTGNQNGSRDLIENGGGIDWLAYAHTYTSGTGLGMLFNSSIHAGQLYTDGEELDIATADAHVGEIRSYNCGYVTSNNCIHVTGNNATVGTITAGGMRAGVTGVTQVLWTGYGGSVSNVNLIGNGENSDVGFSFSGFNNQFSNVNVSGFSGTGATGIVMAGHDNYLSGQTYANTTHVNYSGSTGNNAVNLLIYSTTGDTPLVGTPASTDRFSVLVHGPSGFISGYDTETSNQLLLNGNNALWQDGTTNRNIALGPTAFATTVSQSGGGSNGTRNVAIGYQALNAVTTGYDNIGIGASVGGAIVSGHDSVFVGKSSGTLTTASNEAFFGSTAGQNVSSGSDNTAIGFAAMLSSASTPLTGQYNTALGSNSGASLRGAAAQNTFVGFGSGYSFANPAATTTGSGNILIGYNVLASGSTANNELNIGGAITATALNTATPSVSIPGALTVTGNIGGSTASFSGAVATTGLAGTTATLSGVLTASSFAGAGTGLTGTAASLTAGSVTTNANLTGPVTSSGNATSLAAQTGTGTTFVVSNSPTITGTLTAGTFVPTGSTAPTNGIYYPVSNTLGFAGNGNQVATLSNNAIFNLTGTTTAGQTYNSYKINGNLALWIDGTATGNRNTVVGISGFPTTVLADGGNGGLNGTRSVAIGYQALNVMSTGYGNVAVGSLAGSAITTGIDNVGVGRGAGNGITTGGYNTVLGGNAAAMISTQSSNTVVGWGALGAGSANSSANGTFIGYQAGSGMTGGTGNILVGYNVTLASTATASNQIDLGGAFRATAGTLVGSYTAPTISSGFCSTSPSIPNANGTWAFTINVGTSCSGSTGTLSMPAAATGWACSFQDVTTPASYVISQTGGATNTVTLTSYARTTGIASNFTASDIIRASCHAY